MKITCYVSPELIESLNDKQIHANFDYKKNNIFSFGIMLLQIILLIKEEEINIINKTENEKDNQIILNQLYEQT